MAHSTTTLWRPTGQAELELVGASGWAVWPPRLPEQPIFYPVLSEAYATRIAREWNVPYEGVGHVTEFDVRNDFLGRYEPRTAGGWELMEYWIPADELESFNAAVVGLIRLVATYR